MASQRAQYIASQRNLRFEELNGGATLKVNQPAVDAFINRVDTGLETVNAVRYNACVEIMLWR